MDQIFNTEHYIGLKGIVYIDILVTTLQPYYSDTVSLQKLLCSNNVGRENIVCKFAKIFPFKETKHVHIAIKFAKGFFQITT